MALLRALCRMPARTTSVIKQSTSTPRVIFHNAISRSSSRGYASEAPRSTSSQVIIGASIGLILSGGAYYAGSLQTSAVPQPEPRSREILEKVKAAVNTPSYSPKAQDYQKVYDVVARRLDDIDDYDDGSYGPVLVRLAWHCSGTYDAETKTGGSNGATMRFDPESDHGANAGLNLARLFLEPVKGQYRNAHASYEVFQLTE